AEPRVESIAPYRANRTKTPDPGFRKACTLGAKFWSPSGVTNAGLVPGACTCPAEAFGKVGSNALSARWETPRRLVHRSFSEGGSFRSFSRRADTPTGRQADTQIGRPTTTTRFVSWNFCGI